MTLHNRLAMAAVLLAISLGGCSQAGPTLVGNDSPAGSAQDAATTRLTTDLALARSIWKQARVDDYDFVQQRTCYCRQEYILPIQVSVRNGEIAAATYLEDGMPVPDGVRKTVRTIDDWLDYIATRKLNSPHAFEATFDPRLGYPVDFAVDQHERVADDTEEVSFRDFRALP